MIEDVKLAIKRVEDRAEMVRSLQYTKAFLELYTAIETDFAHLEQQVLNYQKMIDRYEQTVQNLSGTIYSWRWFHIWIAVCVASTVSGSLFGITSSFFSGIP